MIWRDDDISRRTKIPQLALVDDAFQKYGAVHTAALIVEGLDTRPDLVSFMRERKIVPQLHCWEHVDLSQGGVETLHQAVDLVAQLFGQRPTVLYPPWNRTSDELYSAAAFLGLQVSTDKISLDQYLRCNGGVEEQVVNFHYWDAQESRQIADALAIWYQREHL